MQRPNEALTRIDTAMIHGSGTIPRPGHYQQVLDYIAYLESMTPANPMQLDWQREVELFRNTIGEIYPEWAMPSAVDALLYTFQELGEVSSEMMRSGYADRVYSRNSLDLGREQLTIELGQALMMLCTTGSALGLDLGGALAAALEYQEKKLGERYPNRR